MKVLIITHYVGRGLPSTVFIHKQVVELVKLGLEVKVLVLTPFFKTDYFGRKYTVGNKSINVDGVDYTFIKFLSLSKYGAGGINTKNAIKAIKFSTLKEIIKFKADVIHSHTIGFESEIGAFLKQKLNIPLIVTTHGSDTTVRVINKQFNLLKNYCDKADLIVAVSSVLKQRLELSKLNSKVNVILNGFTKNEGEHEKFQEDGRATDIFENKKKLSFLQVGNLIKQKNTDITIRAFNEVLRTIGSGKLTIVGKGPELDSLKELCDELKILDNVEFTGAISNEKVMELMESTEYFIMPSVREGFGVVYIEAMSKGCITIGTRGEGIEDLIIDGDNGFLVPSEDYKEIAKRVLSCIDNRKAMKKLSENAIESVKSLSWRDNAIGYVEEYSKLINNKKH